ncbi:MULTISPECIES: TetR/AcrR family transcriptional regulator [unclassified Amycolatopsis]|uniref:TetR/AcrR family transcriptional regulator n=1 Tax=unclassified Amycolatopsis TaxID=2618356 RepID=UPI002E0FD611|nr:MULTISPECIES: TetR/AcrR family transcriptional regulator [unclassified Amycolatopsis]WSJ79607.1 TetR/AcrR family transcriptional regulator [Amycolatopsis sp. NBC_01307]WSK76915.1 TetR/AcrR family transcriptional regulator [Amycolatopsis sp. NBC_01286]
MPKIIDHDQRRRDIVDVTWDLIVRGGIEAATMREIAAAAGFANGALKLYFAGKEEIIAATYERALDMMREYVALDGLRGLAALRELCVSSMPIDEARITAGRVLLIFWQMSLSDQGMHDKYLEHVREWRGLLHRFLAEGREDGDIVTETPDEQLVDEVILVNAGANVMSLVAGEFSTVALQHRHLESFLARLTKP